ncbi:FAD-dependent oxidoreductase [Acidianus sp. RZ1]|uniref:FAD-dependent oxidoreductase n=1 Tax=Acidianus sp. RZ1 TaxID=1540082 RepID=UPI0014923492|nr:FAD-dependent oxidoreductase [Acidianus sp. RZ1]NON63603.1 FAD-binding oxidoreductase [Acidianus sp. RZ1]
MSTVIVGGGITGLLLSYSLSDSLVVDFKGPKNSMASLWTIIPPLCGDLFGDCLRSEEIYSTLCNKLGVNFKKVNVIRSSEKKLGGKIIESKEIKELEPKVNLEYAELFDNGMFVEGPQIISSLTKDINMKKEMVKKIVFDNKSISYLETENGKIRADQYIFTLGYGIYELIKGLYNIDVNYFKGHLIITKKIGLKGILIVNDRIAVEGDNLYLNGDSKPQQDQSIDYEEISKTLKTFSNVIGPITDKLEVKVGFRTVVPTGPIVTRISDNAILVGGHKLGFALAPILVEKAISLLKG